MKNCVMCGQPLPKKMTIFAVCGNANQAVIALSRIPALAEAEYLGYIQMFNYAIFRIEDRLDTSHALSLWAESADDDVASSDHRVPGQLLFYELPSASHKKKGGA